MNFRGDRHVILKFSLGVHEIAPKKKVLILGIIFLKEFRKGHERAKKKTVGARRSVFWGHPSRARRFSINCI